MSSPTDIIIQIFMFSWRYKFRGVRGVLVTDIKSMNHEQKEANYFFEISIRLQTLHLI